MSKRDWSHKVRVWRTYLHSFDEKVNLTAPPLSSSSSSLTAKKKTKEEIKIKEEIKHDEELEKKQKRVQDVMKKEQGPSIYADFVEDEDDLL